jgi:hypothetical protein
MTFLRTLVRAILASPDGPAAGALEDEAYAFVRRQLARLPDHLRLPVRVLSRTVDGVALRVYARPFTMLSLPQQRYVVARARGSRLGPVRDAMRFYESLALLVREEDGAGG